MAVTKPSIKDKDVWSYGAGEDDILIPYSKIDSGWGYANKPSYQYLNWFWNMASAFFVHYNQNGIAVWDKDTLYGSSGLTKYQDEIFQAFSSIADEVPSAKSRIWSGLEYVDGLADVEVDQTQIRDLLVFQSGSWTNYDLLESNLKVNDLQNVTVTATPNNLLWCNKGNADVNLADAWINKSIRDALKNNINLTDINNVKISNPINDEVLQFIETDVYYEPDDLWFRDYRWVNTFFEGIVNYNTIKNIPEEFNPIKASSENVGGFRIWVASAGGENNLHVDTFDQYPVPAPSGLEATQDQSVIYLTWTGNINTTDYEIFRDGVSVTTVTGTSYDENPGDNEYHIYYVVGIDGGGHKSYPSNTAMGLARY